MVNGFIQLGGRRIRPESIESYHTNYYNGGQTVVTTVRTTSGETFQLDRFESRDLDKLIENVRATEPGTSES